jgi:ribosomal protein L29
MKKQMLDQLRQKSRAELRKDVAEARRELLTMQMAQGQQVAGNVRAKGQLRRKIAVLETFLQVKE